MHPLLLIGLALAGAGVDSTATDGDGHVLPVVEVRAPRPSAQERLDLGTTSATRLDLAQHDPLATPRELLAGAAGLHLRSAGGLGGSTQLSLRGSSAQQVPVYLDGIPLARPDLAASELADLPLGSLEEAVVYRGGGPLLQGAVGPGGSVQLSSPSGPLPWRWSTAAGSHGRRALRAGGGTVAGGWELGLRASWRRADNDWDYLDDNATPYNAADDQVVPRRNNDHEAADALATATRELGGGKLRLSALAGELRQGLPGLGTLPAERAAREHRSLALRAGWEAPADGWWRRATLWARGAEDELHDRGGELGLGRTDRDDRLRQLGLDLGGALVAGGEEAWALQLRHESLEGIEHAQEGAPALQRQRRRAALALRPRWWGPDDRWLLEPSVRVGRLADDGDALGDGDANDWDASAQLGARLALGRAWSLRLAGGLYRRVPTLLERYGSASNVLGNPGLEAERGLNREVGLLYQPGGGRRVALVAFANHSEGLILFRPVNPAWSRAMNVGEATLRGVELEAATGRVGAFDLQLHYTRLSTVQRGDDLTTRGHPLPGRPGHEMLLRAAWWLRGARLQYELAAIGENFLDSAGRTRLPGRALHQLSLRLPLGPLALELTGENLSDREHQDLYGYPLPGRAWRVALGSR